MELTRNGITIVVDEAAILSIIADRLSGRRYAFVTPSNETPRIGQPWPGQGGIYAGVMRGRNGGADYHLIVGPEIEETTWEKAKAKAAEISQDGYSDFSLPFRAEQALQLANVPELFKKEWYWSSEQHAEDADYAWYQDFGNGFQNDFHKDDEFRARAVRRLVIQ